MRSTPPEPEGSDNVVSAAAGRVIEYAVGAHRQWVDAGGQQAVYHLRRHMMMAGLMAFEAARTAIGAVIPGAQRPDKP